MEALQLEGYTVDDILALPEGERAELIDGQWYDMASPSPVHQEIVSILTRELGNYIQKKGGKCKVYPAPFAVFINKDRKNYVEPDVSVVCDPKKISDRGCEGAPDLVVEVASPSTEGRDYMVKLLKYRSSGVREYWIVNPMTKTVTVYIFENGEIDPDTGEDEGNVRQVSFSEAIPSFLYEDFSLTLSEFM